jgi:hypothetical protein
LILYPRFEARLVDLGHDAEDVERMFDHHHYGVLDKEFTEARQCSTIFEKIYSYVDDFQAGSV